MKKQTGTGGELTSVVYVDVFFFIFLKQLLHFIECVLYNNSNIHV